MNYWCILPTSIGGLIFGSFSFMDFFFLSYTHVMVLPFIFIFCELYNSCYFVALFVCMFILCLSKKCIHESYLEGDTCKWCMFLLKDATLGYQCTNKQREKSQQDPKTKTNWARVPSIGNMTIRSEM